MSCQRCGRCCQVKTLLKDSNWNVKEKIMFRIILFLRYGFKGFRLSKVKCPHLRFRNRNAYCAIYDKRPSFCREYFCEKAIN